MAGDYKRVNGRQRACVLGSMGLTHDLRQAARGLGRVPGTALLCAATLALGIAASSTTFSAVYAALFRPLPFAEPDRLALLQQVRTNERTGTIYLRWSYAAGEELRRATRSFEAVGSYSRASVSISGSGDAEQVDGELVNAGYFDVLRVAPVIGQGLTAADDTAARPVVLIADSLWRSRFGGDPAVVGRALDVNGVPLTIGGVLPPGFAGISGRAVLWAPSTLAPRMTYRDYLTTPQHFINVIARLRPGATIAQASAELAVLGPSLPHQPGAPGSMPATWSAAARSLADARIDPAQRRSLLLILGGAGCLLLVTCVNVALILVTRARMRRGETAIRLALGASRVRLAREFLVESALVASAGAIAGTLLASWGVAWLRAAAPVILPSAQNTYGQIATFAEPSMDGAILLFVVLVTAVVTMMVGAAPALSAASANPASALAGSSRALAGRAGGRLLPGLVVAQMAVAVLLVSGAVLLARTVTHLEAGRDRVNQGAMSFWINAPGSRYGDETGPAVVERVLSRIARIPGVTDAAVNRCTPYGASCARALLFLPGRSTRAADAPVVERHYVSGSYFRAAGIALRRGRLLNDDDRPGRPAVTVINETAARRFWPGEDPIGKRLWFSANPGFDDPAAPVEVVGVVADVKYWPANDAIGPDFYTSYLQFTYPSSMYIVNAIAGAEVLPAIRRAVAEIDPAMAVYDVRSIDERVDEATGGARFVAATTGMFAAAAAALAALGVFGVMAFSVASRRDELALRLALGATPRRLQTSIVSRALRLALAGAAAGIALSVWLLRAAASALYGVSPVDPLTLASATAAMLAVSVAAAAIPAWRASTTDPMLALRS